MSTVPGNRTRRIWTPTAQALLGAAALAVVSFARLRLEASTETAPFLFLLGVVPVAIAANETMKRPRSVRDLTTNFARTLRQPS